MQRGVSYQALAALALSAAIFAAPVQGSVIYNSIPGPLPPNVPSLGYQANQTSEFGDLIQFDGADRTLSRVTLVLSDWALASAYNSTSPTWNHPITLNLYNVDNSGANPAPGTLIATQTHTFAIPWRPEADPTCPGGTAWRASDGNCYNGLAFTITFDFTGTIVPNQIIYGVAFNTKTWGYQPIGQPGPYESLNFGLADVPPSVGSNPFPDTAYWNTATPSNYSDGGAGGVGIFRRDTGWTPYSGAVSFEVNDSLLINYFAGANGARPDQTMRITNPGTATDLTGNTTADLCANIYVFRNDQQLTECCSCLVTPNGLRTLSVDFDLTHNPLTPGAIGEGVFKLVSSQVPTGGCTSATAASAYTPIPALRAWGTHNQDVSGGLQGAAINQVTETHFLDATLSPAELKSLQSNCAFINSQGSGHGICSCGRGD